MKLKYLTRLLLILMSINLTVPVLAQGDSVTSQVEVVNSSAEQRPSLQKKSEVPTTNILHQNKRINLVVFVLATIFVGIILYLIRLERKIKKLENNIN